MLGTPALFATAYGNVGSSIYYALGVTAVFALGLTPLVFVIAGSSSPRRRRPTRRAPSASRRPAAPSSFARHAFNELVSFGAALGADAQLRHHDRHLGVLRPALPLDLLGAAADEPVGHRRRRGRDRRARRPEHRRDPGGGEAEHLPRGHRLRDAAAARAARLRARLQPDDPRDNVHWGVAPTWTNFFARDPGGDDRLHGDRDRLQPRRGGARPAARRSRARSSSSPSPSSRSTSRCRSSRSRRCR